MWRNMIHTGARTVGKDRCVATSVVCVEECLATSAPTGPTNHDIIGNDGRTTRADMSRWCTAAGAVIIVMSSHVIIVLSCHGDVIVVMSCHGFIVIVVMSCHGYVVMLVMSI